MSLASRDPSSAPASGEEEAPRGRHTRPVCLLLLLTLTPVLLIGNPVVLGAISNDAAIEVACLLLLDLLLLAVMVLCWRGIRTGRRGYRRAAMAGLIAIPFILAGAEALILQFRADYQRLLGDGTRPDLPRNALLRRDDRFGWSLRANATAGPPTMVIDGEGRRRTPPPAAGVTRTLHAFGDSFLFGQGVPQRHNALNLLARRFHDRAGVLNYAVSGYGLEQMTRRLEAADVRPGDLVLIAPITDDLRRNLIGKQQVCAHDREGFAGERFPMWVDGGWRYEPLADHCPELGLPLSRLLGALEQTVGLTERRLLANADQVLHHARRVAEAKGARFALVFQPNFKECEKGRFDLDPAALTVPFTSLMSACADFDPAKDYMLSKADYHWNENGHRWLAETLARFIEAHDLLGGAAPASRTGQAACRPHEPAAGKSATCDRSTSASPLPR
jgi:hypothetical protein